MSAADPSASAPDLRMHGRIMAAVRRGPAPAAPLPVNVFRWAPVYAAAALAAIALVLFTDPGRPRPANPPVARQPLPRLEWVSAGFDAGEWLAVPYEREWGLLADDLASSGAFLADCLGLDIRRL